MPANQNFLCVPLGYSLERLLKIFWQSIKYLLQQASKILSIHLYDLNLFICILSKTINLYDHNSDLHTSLSPVSFHAFHRIFSIQNLLQINQ